MAGTWRVVTQQQREELTAQNTFVQVMEIGFELTSGTRGSVVVPTRLYSEEYVRAQIELKASAMAAVENLAG